MSCNNYSAVVEAIIHSNGEPAIIPEAKEVITVNGETGIYANKSEAECFQGPVPLSKYPVNEDPEAVTINKNSNCIPCNRKVFVKYLEPPAIPAPKPIIINQEANILPPEAPPVIMRQLPEDPLTPPPLVIREVPPEIPKPPAPRIITIPGKMLPPPPRKVIIEKLPEMPDPPQNVFIERWLPFKDIKRKITLKPKPSDPKQCKPKNIIVNWSIIPCCKVRQDIKDLGTEKADPQEYVKLYGESLIPSEKLPEVADRVNEQHGKLLAANNNIKYFSALEGDLHALKLIEAELGLDSEGLSEFKHLLNYIESSNDTKDDATSNFVLSNTNTKKLHICEDGVCRLVSQIEIEEKEAEEPSAETSYSDELEESDSNEKSEFLDTVESTSYDIDGSSTSSSSEFTSTK